MENILLCTRSIIMNTRKQIISLFASGYFTLPVPTPALHPCLPQHVVVWCVFTRSWGAELVIYCHCHTVTAEGLMHLRVQKAMGQPQSLPKGFLPLHGILGETKGSNSTSKELVQTPHVHVQEEVCPTRLTCSSHLDAMKSCQKKCTPAFSQWYSLLAHWQKLDFGTVLPKHRNFFGSSQGLSPVCSSGGSKMKLCSSHV